MASIRWLTTLVRLVCALTLAVAALGPANPALAVPAGCALLVTNTNDSGDGSLRAAVACAAAGQTVTFSSALAGGTINLTSGQITLPQPITVDGSAAPGVTVNANHLSRIFNLTANGTVTLQSLILINGYGSANGGAILAGNMSPLVLNQVAVLGSVAGFSGGGLYSQSAITVAGGGFRGNRCQWDGCAGGGLYAGSTLTVNGAEFIENDSQGDGGGAFAGEAQVSNSVFRNNVCLQSLCVGGGIRTLGGLTLIDTDVIGNATSHGGGGALASGPAVVTNGRFQDNTCRFMGCDGGGLHAGGTLTMVGTEFVDNTSGTNGGGAYAAGPATLIDVRFEHNACTASYGCFGGGFVGRATGTVISATTFIANVSVSAGGGASVGAATVIGSSFQANRCTGSGCFGGGLHASHVNLEAVIVVTDTVFVNNISGGGGGGAYFETALILSGGRFINNICLSFYCIGGGLGTDRGLRLSNTTLSGNQAEYYGGGVYIVGFGELHLANVTLTGNTAGEAGGGLYAGAIYPNSLQNVTVVDNQAPSGGGLFVMAGASLALTNTVLANNGPANCAGVIAAGANNLEWPGNTCATAGPSAGFSLADPLLEKLDSPGTAIIYGLAGASPARDAGQAAACAGPLVNNRDQRGAARPQDSDGVPGALCDIGAYEASSWMALEAFTATVGAGAQVTLTWQTTAEVGLTGFNMLRSAGACGPWMKMNGALIPAVGNVNLGHAYVLLDTPGVGPFSYRLVAVDAYGPATQHGPVSVTAIPGAPQQCLFVPQVFR